jgi:hypothetical protein
MMLREDPLITSGVELRAAGILLNTMPKSGSVYILNSLAKIVDLKTMYFGNPRNGQISLQDVMTFNGGGYVAQNHVAPSPENLKILEQFKPKMVLHLRDPRQALLSWIHHVDWKNTTEGFVLPVMPPRYFELSLSSKIDWQIEFYLPHLINWTKRWVEFADQETIPTLITHQNDLRCDERAFFDRILAFYQIKLDFALPNLPRTLETHFRKADPEEWRRTFTPEQAALATSAIPDSLQAQFGWHDEG